MIVVSHKQLERVLAMLERNLGLGLAAAEVKVIEVIGDRLGGRGGLGVAPRGGGAGGARCRSGGGDGLNFRDPSRPARRPCSSGRNRSSSSVEGPVPPSDH